MNIYVISADTPDEGYGVVEAFESFEKARDFALEWFRHLTGGIANFDKVDFNVWLVDDGDTFVYVTEVNCTLESYKPERSILTAANAAVQAVRDERK